MLQPKLRNLAITTQIQTCMASIETTKNELKQKIINSFIELKKRICLSLQKAQKSYIAKINDACISSIDTLSVVNDVQLSNLEVERYVYQTDKLTTKLKELDIEKLLKGFSDEIKANVDQIRKYKILEDIPAISEQRQTMKLDRTLKVQSQPATKIFTINKKLCIVTPNSVSLQKHTITKQFDYILPIKIQNKTKQILFTLHNNTIGLYSDKLTLHSFRAYTYTPTSLISIVQLGHYVFITETHKITRINLGNLNQMLVKVFSQDVVTVGDALYQNYVQVGFLGKVVLYDFQTLEEIVAWNVQGRPRKIYNIKQYLVVTFGSGMKIYKNLEQLQLHNSITALKILQVIEFVNYLMLITTQSHIYYLNPETQQNNLPIAQRVNQGLTKTIKSVASEGYQIYCLGDNGTKIYVHSL